MADDDPWAAYLAPAAPSGDDQWSQYLAPPTAPRAPTAPASSNIVPPGGGQPGLSWDPLAGLPTSVAQFLGNGSDPTPTGQPWSGQILPISGDGKGNVSLDSNAGILGSIKNAVTLPGDVATGQVDPMSPEAIGRSAELAGVASPINPGARAGEAAIPGAASAFTPGKVIPPTADALRAAAKEGYNTAAAAGVDYSSPHVADLAQGVQSDLNGKGIIGTLAPKTHAILNQLQAVPAGESSVPFGSLDAARKAFGHAAGDFTNPTEQLAAKTAQRAVDGFVSAPPAGAVVAGDAPAASQAVQDARANYAAASRSDTLNGIEEKAELRAAAANSGANTGNSIRSRVASLLSNPKQSAGFSPDEIDALNEVVRGSPTRNAVRIAGNLLGGGGGMHGAGMGLVLGTMGEHMGGPAGAAIGVAAPFAGAGLKHLDNSMTGQSLTAADELTRSRSPLADALKSDTSPVLDSPTRRAALARALLSTSPPQWSPGQSWNPANPMGGGSV